MQQRIIGITGGIATGKTTVSDYLHLKYGLPILDADIYARQALTGDRLEQLRDRYGEQVFDYSNNAEGILDRQKLGAIIFADAAERLWLESLIHPYVQETLIHEAQKLAPATVVMVIPLLFETGMQNLVTEIWAIACDPKVQLQRLMQRNHLTKSEALQRINSQKPQVEKLLLADAIIVNNQANYQTHRQAADADDLLHLYSQIDQAFLAPTTK
jgi:dephospho-CoA kinase